MLVAQCSYGQLFTNYSVSLCPASSGPYTFNLPTNSTGTLNISIDWIAFASLTRTAGQAPIDGDFLLSTTYVGAGSTNTLSHELSLSEVTASASTSYEASLTLNYAIAVPVTSYTILSTVREMYSVSGGNYTALVTASNSLNVAYTYSIVPEPETVALCLLGIAAFMLRFGRRIRFK